MSSDKRGANFERIRQSKPAYAATCDRAFERGVLAASAYQPSGVRRDA